MKNATNHKCCPVVTPLTCKQTKKWVGGIINILDFIFFIISNNKQSASYLF